jgi:hypothetical protein
MSKFLVLYKAPTSVLDEWMKKPAEERKEEEQKMQGEWNEWMSSHKDALLETAGAGKTKSVTSSGISDVRNDIMLYSIVEAESHEAAAKMFEGHSHLQIPQSSIEVMAANPLPGMGG